MVSASRVTFFDSLYHVFLVKMMHERFIMSLGIR